MENSSSALCTGIEARVGAGHWCWPLVLAVGAALRNRQRQYVNMNTLARTCSSTTTAESVFCRIA